MLLTLLVDRKTSLPTVGSTVGVKPSNCRTHRSVCSIVGRWMNVHTIQLSDTPVSVLNRRTLDQRSHDSTVGHTGLFVQSSDVGWTFTRFNCRTHRSVCSIVGRWINVHMVQLSDTPVCLFNRRTLDGPTVGPVWSCKLIFRYNIIGTLLNEWNGLFFGRYLQLLEHPPNASSALDHQGSCVGHDCRKFNIVSVYGNLVHSMLCYFKSILEQSPHKLKWLTRLACIFGLHRWSLACTLPPFHRLRIPPAAVFGCVGLSLRGSELAKFRGRRSIERSYTNGPLFIFYVSPGNLTNSLIPYLQLSFCFFVNVIRVLFTKLQAYNSPDSRRYRHRSVPLMHCLL